MRRRDFIGTAVAAVVSGASTVSAAPGPSRPGFEPFALKTLPSELAGMSLEDLRDEYRDRLFNRYLPFWLANFLDRMKIMLVPLVAILIPFLNFTPQLYRWRMRSKIFRWYQELELLDPELHCEKINTQLPEYLTRLDKLEQKVSNVKVPLGYRESVYNLRIHIDMIRKRLIQTQGSELDPDSICIHSEEI